jgi:hypothetical protein
MKRGNQSRLDKLTKTKPQRVYVFWVPKGRADDVNIADANQWLQRVGLPARTRPMIFVNPKLDEMWVEVIEDFAAVMAQASAHP